MRDGGTAGIVAASVGVLAVLPAGKVSTSEQCKGVLCGNRVSPRPKKKCTLIGIASVPECLVDAGCGATGLAERQNSATARHTVREFFVIFSPQQEQSVCDCTADPLHFQAVLATTEDIITACYELLSPPLVSVRVLCYQS